MLTLTEAVRKRPGMYFGNIEYDGANVIVHELVANVIDLYLAGSATTVNISLKNHKITVEDDGPGFPFSEQALDNSASSLAEYYFLHRHNAPTADQHAPHIHVFKGGLGLAVLNAASSLLHVESADGTQRWRQTFGQGEVKTPATRETGEFPQGTKIEITLDPIVFGDYFPNSFMLRRSLFELVHLYPGLTIELEQERFYSKNGLLDLAYILQKQPAFNQPCKSFRWHQTRKNVEFQVAALGDSDSRTAFVSWANGCFTKRHGSHVAGFSQALKQSGWRPEIALVHVVMHDPRFSGPCADRLHYPEAVSTLAEALAEPLANFASSIKTNAFDERRFNQAPPRPSSASHRP